MLEPGQRIELDITDVAFGGRGVARQDDQVVFVPQTDAGERVRAEIRIVKKNYAEARLLEVLGASAHRVEPKCKYYGACAGCQYQHLDYRRQLEIKGKQLKDALERIGRLQVPVDPVIPSPVSYAYRNKLSITWLSGRLGLFAEDNHTLIGIDRCEIALPEVNEKLAELRSRKIKPPKSGRNRQSFVLRTDALQKRLPDHAFAQVNDSMVPVLKDLVGSLLRPAEVLVDAYCGSGFFALELAGAAKKIIGIEFHRESIDLARREAKTRGLAHVEFVQGRVEQELPAIASKHSGRFTVILDPPRTGASPEILDTLLATRPSQVIYVSCNPATLARDLGTLSTGFRIDKIAPLDMFPQTQHLETVCALSPRPNA